MVTPIKSNMLDMPPHLRPMFFHPDGRRKTAAERTAEGKAIKYERQREAQQERERARLEAIYNPPPPAPPLPTAEERETLRKAEEAGKRHAAERAAEREAARQAAGPPRNVFRERADQLAKKLYIPANQRIYERFVELANDFDEKMEAQRAERERQERIANDPAIQNAIENAEAVFRQAAPEDKADAFQNLAIAREGEVDLYWTNARDLEKRAWAREDARLSQMEIVTGDQLAAFQEQARKLKEVGERLAVAEGMNIENENPEQN